MKKSTPLAAIASFCLLGLTASAGAVAPKAKAPFLGKWALDVKSMPVTYGTPPKSVTYEFVDLDNGRWETRIHIVDNGGVRDIAVSYPAMGKPMRAAAMPERAIPLRSTRPRPTCW